VNGEQDIIEWGVSPLVPNLQKGLVENQADQAPWIFRILETPGYFTTCLWAHGPRDLVYVVQSQELPLWAIYKSFNEYSEALQAVQGGRLTR
jgi:hypothetical protein